MKQPKVWVTSVELGPAMQLGTHRDSSLSLPGNRIINYGKDSSQDFSSRVRASWRSFLLGVILFFDSGELQQHKASFIGTTMEEAQVKGFH